MKIKFLLDENLSPRIKAAGQCHATEIDILRVGDETAPSLATSDPDILVYLASAQRLLVSDNRSTIPVHLAAHMTADRPLGNYLVARCPKYRADCRGALLDLVG